MAKAPSNMLLRLLFVVLACTVSKHGSAEPGDILKLDVPIISEPPPRVRDLKVGDATVATQTGALQYSFPIEVPPGRLGVQPNLALNYSSQGSIYGGIAAGWSLNVPEIRLDSSGGVLAERQGNETKHFISTMAGDHRLIAVTEPTSPPPDSVETFRAEDDASYTRYERLESTRWRALTHDGKTYYFGDTNHMVGPSEERRSPLTRMVDPFGNTVHYFWGADTYQVPGVDAPATTMVYHRYLTSVTYTDDARSGGLEPFARVVFDWAEPSYCGSSKLPTGAKFSMNGKQPLWEGARQLNAIRTEVIRNGRWSPQRTVVLNYDAESVRCDRPHGSFRLLASIQETAFDALGVATSRPPVTFGYGPLERTFSVRDHRFDDLGELYSGTPNTVGLPEITVPRLETMLMDLTGDGRIDRLKSAMMPGSSTCAFILDRNNGTGFDTGTPQQLPMPSFRGIDDAPPLSEHCSLSGYVSQYNLKQPQGHPQCGPPDHPGHLFAYRFLDMDADGLPDLVTALHPDLRFYDPSTDVAFLATLRLSPTCRPADQDACRAISSSALNRALRCSGVAAAKMCALRVSVLDSALDEAAPIGCDELTARRVATNWQGIDLAADNPDIDICSGNTSPRTPFKHCGRYPWQWYKNNGEGQFDLGAPRLTLSPVALEPSGGETGYGGGRRLTSQIHGIIDLDGDGYLDAVSETGPEGQPSAGGWLMWRGDGHGNFLPRPNGQPYFWQSPSEIGGAGSTPTSVTTRIQLLDMNDDGLVDLVEQQVDGIVRTYFNDGDGFRPSVPLKPGALAHPELRPEINTTGWSQVSGSDLAPKRETRIGPFDIDGDGRIDFFDRGPLFQPPNQVDMHMTDGAGNSNAPVRLPATNYVQRIHQIIEFVLGDNWYQNQDAIDINGDGVVDLVSLNPETGWIVSTDQRDGKPNRLLNRIDNGAGLTTEVTYAALTDRSAHIAPGQSGIPQHMWLVRELRTTNAHVAEWPDDPLLPPPDVATTTYSYGPPVWNQDNRDRYGFRGFREVHTRTPRDATTVEKYSYDIDWSGRLTETAKYPAPNTALEQKFDRISSLQQATYEPRYLFGGAARSFVITDRRSYTCRDGQSREQCLDTASGSAVLHERTRWSLHPNLSAALLWAPVEFTKTQALDVVSGGDKREFYVNQSRSDSNQYRLHRRVTRFHEAVHTDRQVVWQQFAEHIEKLDPTFRSVSEKLDWLGDRYVRQVFQHYPSGQLKEVQRRQQAFVDSPRTVRYEYDANEVFVSRTTNELDHVVYTSHDVGTGALLSTRGPNGTGCSIPGSGTCDERQTRVDGFGRPTQEFVSVDGPSGGYLLPLASRTSYFDFESPSRVREERSINLEPDNTHVRRVDTTFDGYGRIITVMEFSQNEQPDGRAVFRYDPQGNLLSFEGNNPSGDGPASVIYGFTHDSLNQLETATRPGGSGFVITRDGLVETRGETLGPTAPPSDPKAVTRTARDVFGRLVLVEEKIEGSDFARSGYAYGGHDNLVRVDSADGNTTTLTYDHLGRRTAITRGSQTWRYEYDDNDNLVHEIAPHIGPNESAYTTSTTYDDIDRPSSRLIGVRALSAAELREMGHGVTLYTYDEGRNGVGRLTGVSRRAGLDASSEWSTLSLVYDGRGLITKKTRSFDLSEVLGVAGLSDSRHIERSFNGLAEVTEEWHGDGDNVASSTHTTSSYDLRGNPASLVWNRGGAPTTLLTLTRNALGQVTLAGSDLQDQPLKQIEQRWTRDRLGRVRTHDINVNSTGLGETPLSGEAMTYYDTDDIATLASERIGLPAHSFVFSYDDRHQLTGATNDRGYTAHFSYSRGGLLASANIDAPDGAPQAFDRHVNYDYSLLDSGDPNEFADPEAVTRLTNVEGGALFADYDHDTSGNVIRREDATGIYSFLYDGDDHQRKARAPNQESELYYYDEHGQRILAVIRSPDGAVQRVRFWFDSLEVQYNGAGSIERTWVHLGFGMPIARVERVTEAEPTLEYQFHNGLGHFLGATSEADTTLATAYIYGPFGEVLAESGDTADHTRKFNGKEQDVLSGLSYYGFRYYDPLSLQWTQADPLRRLIPDLALQEPRRLNLYTFNLNNPVRYIDPDGLEEKDAGAIDAASDLPLCGDVAGPVDCKPQQEVEYTPDDRAYALEQSLNTANLATAIEGALTEVVDFLDFTQAVFSPCPCSISDWQARRDTRLDRVEESAQWRTQSSREQHQTEGLMGPRVPKGKAIKVDPTPGGLRPLGKPMTPEQARKAVQRGQHVYTPSRSTANKIAGRNSVGPEAHPRVNQTRFQHLHRVLREGAHIFFGKGRAQ